MKINVTKILENKLPKPNRGEIQTKQNKIKKTIKIK